MEEQRSNTAVSGHSGVQPQGQVINADTQVPVSGYGLPQISYPIEDLEVHEQGSVAQAQTPYVSPKVGFIAFSRRKAMIVSIAITVIVTLITGASILLLARNTPKNEGNKASIQQQDIALNDAAITSLPEVFNNATKSLLINGDVVTKGSLKVTSGAYAAILKTTTLSANQTYTLPNSSGTLCLSNNNCNFVTSEALNATNVTLTDLQNRPPQIPITPTIPNSSFVNAQNGAVILQGTASQVIVTTANGTITVSAPQDLAQLSSPTFAGLNINGNLALTGTLTLPLDCTTFLNGGSLSTNNTGQVICLNDESSGAGASVTTVGGAPGTIAMFTAGAEIGNSIISQAVGTITIAGNLLNTGAFDVSGNITQTGSSTISTGTGAISLNGPVTVASNQQFTALGATLFRDATNSATAFQIQNAASNSALNVSTIYDTYTNLIANPDFESGTTGWSQNGSAAISSSALEAHGGALSMQVVTTSAANDGARFPVPLSPSTSYVLSMWVKASGSSIINDLVLGYTRYGQLVYHDCTISSTTAGGGFSPTEWSQFTCSFTTTNDIGGVQNIYIRRSNSILATGVTVYIDDVRLHQTVGNKLQIGQIGTPGLGGLGQLQFAYDGGGNISLQPAVGSGKTENFILTIPAESGVICTTANTSPCATGSDGRYLSKVTNDAAVVAVSNGNFLYRFDNSSSAVSSGVLRLENNTNTGEALRVRSTIDSALNPDTILVNAQNSTFSRLKVFTSGKIGINPGSVLPSTDATFGDLSFGGGVLATPRTINVLQSTVLNAAGGELRIAGGKGNGTGIGGTITLQGGDGGGGGSASNGGGVSIQVGAATGTGTLGSINIGSTTATSAIGIGASSVAGTITVGGLTQTGTTIIGQSSATNTIRIGDAQGGAGNTIQTILMGTQNGAGGGNDSSVINIGSNNQVSSLNLRVGAGNFTLDGRGDSTYDLGASTTTGTIRIGGTSQTGDIIIGRHTGNSSILIGDVDATGGTTQTIQLGGTNVNGGGVGITDINIGASDYGRGTITIGRSARYSSDVDISNVSTISATNTINIGGGTSTTSGGRVVNIADGIPGASTTNSVSIGSKGTTTGTVGITIGSVGATTHTTLIQGGNGAGAITLNTAGGSIELQDNANVTGALGVSGNADVGGTLIAGTGNAFQVTTAGTVKLGNGAPSFFPMALQSVHTFSAADSCSFGCYGVFSGPVADAPTNPSFLMGYATTLSTANTAFTLGNAYGLYVTNPNKGAASTITNNYGINILNQTAGTNDYGIYIAGADTYALWVDNGATRLDGSLDVQGNISIGDATTDRLTVTSQLLGTSPLVFQGVTDDVNKFTIAVADPSADRTYTIPNSSALMDTFCLVALGNCAGSGGGVTGSGTNNQVVKFTSTGSTVGDSTLSDDGANVTTSIDLVIQGGSATLGTTGQVGTLVLSDGVGGETVTLQSADQAASRVLTIPIVASNADFCLSTGNCAGAGGGITGPGTAGIIPVYTGGGATIGNSVLSQSGGNVGINDLSADVALEVLSTTEQLRLTYTDGTVDSRFTLDSSGDLTINNTGTKTVIADDLQVTGNDILDSTGTTMLTLGSSVTVYPSLLANGNVTLGDNSTDRVTFTSQILGANPLVLQGATDNAFTTSIGVEDPTANVTYRFATAAAGTYDVCTSVGNCVALVGNTLKQSYDNDVDAGDVTIGLTATDGSLIVSNPASSGSASVYALKVEQLDTGAVGGVLINNLGAGYALRVDDDAADTTPFIITSTGNVGIGDATPSALLTVGNGDLFQVQSTGQVRTINGDATSPAYAFTGAGNMGMYAVGADNMGFSTVGVERIRIDSNGAVGIGAASSIGSPALHVAGTISLTDKFYFAGQSAQTYYIQYYGTSSGFELVQNSTQELFIDPNTHRWGIADASPDAKFDIDAAFAPAASGTTNNTGLGTTVTNTVNKTSGVDNTYGQQLSVTRTGATAGVINNYGLQVTVTGDTGGTSLNTGLSVAVSGADTNYAAIFQGGFVGIGQATPLDDLHIASADPTIRLQNSTGSYADTGVEIYDGAVYRARIGGVNGGGVGVDGMGSAIDIRLLADDAQSVILAAGTDSIDPTFKLSATGINYSQSNVTQFSVSTTAAYFLPSVGIGDTTPDAQLDVDSTNTTTNVVGVTSSTITTGDIINLQNNSAVSSGSDLIYGRHLATYITTVNNSGSLLELDRVLTTNTGGALTQSGDVGWLTSSCTVTAGTCTDTSNILELDQQYASSTGAVLNVLGAGTGNLATYDATNASANGVSIDVQSSSSSQYALDVRSANGTSRLYVRADGNVGIGTTTLTEKLEVAGNVAPDVASSYDLGTSVLPWRSLYLGDTNGLVLGLNQDATLAYDDATDDRVELTGTGASLFIEDRFGLGVQVLTLTDDGTANDALTPTTSYVRIDIDEIANGGIPDLTISEASAKDGDTLIIVNNEQDASEDTFTITNSAGVIQLPGGATLTLGPNDAVTLIYMNDRWVTLSNSNN